MKAKQYYSAHKHLSAFFILAAFLTLYLLWNRLFGLFTTSEEIMKIGRETRLVVCIVMIFDHW